MKKTKAMEKKLILSKDGIYLHALLKKGEYVELVVNKEELSIYTKTSHETIVNENVIKFIFCDGAGGKWSTSIFFGQLLRGKCASDLFIGISGGIKEPNRFKDMLDLLSGNLLLALNKFHEEN
jgi:hypothetical protein